MLASRKKFNTIPTWIVIMSLILLSGVLSMGFGYYRDNNVAIYFGIAVTIVAAFNLIMFSVVMPNMLKVVIRRR